jgi:tetratricopeptide (TPR) repeat protein
MDSQSRNQIIGFALVAIAAVIVGGYVLWQGAHHQGFGNTQTATTTSGTTTTMQISSTTEIVTTPTGQSYTVTQLPIKNAPPAPAFKGAISCPSDMAPEVCTNIQTRDATIVARLQKSSTDFAAWVDLGTLRKIAGDYPGAIAAWNYVVALYPSNATAYYNLGDLYQNSLKDYAKAEVNYLLAIKYAPSDPGSYENLFTIYTTTSYKAGTTAAADILKKGIVANPKSVDLQVMLARYYKSQGNSTAAKAEYDAAIQNAQSQGQASLAAEIQKEEAGQ